MTSPPDKSLDKAEAFIARWQGQEGGQERANYTLFLTELCDVLDLPHPDPAGATRERNDYVFERVVTRHRDDGDAIGRIDLYRRNSFVLEAKQSRWKGGDKAIAGQSDLFTAEKDSKKDAPERGKSGARRAWDVLMINAKRQAEEYARALPPSHGWPCAGRSLRRGRLPRYDADMSVSHRKTAASDRDSAAYTLAEAARYLRLPAATLRSWVHGRDYPTTEGSGKFPPLIRPASKLPPLLSFSNLIEAHVLRSLRAVHEVPVKALRDALAYAENELSIDRLLLRPELRAEAGKVFLDRYGQLIELTASGQLAMRQFFDEHLKRIEWDASKFPVRLYPFLSAATPSDARPIVINPCIAFGRPVVESKGVSTSTIVERIDAGESVEDVANDYDLGKFEIEQAILYERAA